MLSEPVFTFRGVVAGGLLVWLICWAIAKDRGRHGTSCWAAVTLYWLALMSFFWPAVIYDYCLVPGDILFQYYPWKAVYPETTCHNHLLSDAVTSIYPWMYSWKYAVEQGAWPLWNFHSYCGSPLAANLASAAFHPFNFLFLIMSVEDVSTLLPFLRLFLAATGTYALLRAWGLPIASSFLGGILFSFCGVHVVWLSNYPNINVTMLMPWIFLSLDRIATGRHWIWMPALAALSVLQFLGGHPESSFHLYVAAFPFFVWRLYGEWRKGIRIRAIAARMCLMGCGGLLALTLSAFQLLPFMEYLPLTTRYQEIVGRGENLLLYLDFGQVFRLITATLLTPDFYGNPVDGNYWGFANYNEQNAHITVIGLLLALLAFARGGSRRALKRFLAFLALFSFLIAIRTPGLFELVVSLPLFMLVCNHRLIFVFAFCASLLAALEAADCQTGKRGRAWIPLVVAAVLVALAGVLHLSTAADLGADHLHYYFVHLGIFLVFLVMATALLVAGRRHPQMGRRLPLLAAGLVILEVFVWGANYNTFIDRDHIFPGTPMLDYIKSRPGWFRVVGWKGCLFRGSEQVYRFDSIIGMDPMKLSSYERVMARINGVYHAVDTPDVMSLSSPWLDFLNVRYVAVGPKVPDSALSSERFLLVYEGSDGRVYENLKSLPRAFWAEEVLFADSHTQALKMAIARENDLNRVVVLEQPESVDQRVSDAGTMRNPLPVMVRRTGNHLVLKVEARDPAYLVLSEVYYPGWHIRLDGKEATLLRANSAFVATFIPAGTETVEFYYDPQSFKTGLVISGCGIFVLLISGIVGIRQWRISKKND